MKRICECGKDISNDPNPCVIYCDECVDRRAKAWASWAVGEITAEQRDKLLNKYESD